MSDEVVCHNRTVGDDTLKDSALKAINRMIYDKDLKLRT